MRLGLFRFATPLGGLAMLTSGTLPRDAVAGRSDAHITISEAPQVSSRSEGRASPAPSDRVNILGVGATPQDLDVAVATLDWWRAEGDGNMSASFPYMAWWWRSAIP
jgi:hypothetical protein